MKLCRHHSTRKSARYVVLSHPSAVTCVLRAFRHKTSGSDERSYEGTEILQKQKEVFEVVFFVEMIVLGRVFSFCRVRGSSRVMRLVW